jgi:hypothetical protein
MFTVVDRHYSVSTYELERVGAQNLGWFEAKLTKYM